MVESKNIVKNIRIAQAIFLGIFTLGLAMSIGDVSEVIKIPISAFSLTTTLFGLMGSILCEMFARKAEKW